MDYQQEPREFFGGGNSCSGKHTSDQSSPKVADSPHYVGDVETLEGQIKRFSHEHKGKQVVSEGFSYTPPEEKKEWKEATKNANKYSHMSYAKLSKLLSRSLRGSKR
jgi:hypothetical protein